MREFYKLGEDAAFEKLGLLWSPTVTKQVAPGVNKFTEMARDIPKFVGLQNRMADLRAKNSGAKVNSIFAWLRGNKRKYPLGSMHPSVGFSKTHIRMPVKDHSRPILIHHELDEAQTYQPVRKRFWDTMKSIDKDKSLGVVEGHQKGMAALKTYRAGSSPSYYSHLDPEVILKESNRVFSEGTPEVHGGMRALRRFSEGAELKQLGLRYGNEFVPEGGRRWKKLLQKLRAGEGTKRLRSREQNDVAFGRSGKYTQDMAAKSRAREALAGR